MTETGKLWVDGEIGIAQEHMITNIMSKLNNEDSNVDDSITCLVQLIHTCINCKNIKLALVKSRLISMKNHEILPKKLKFKLMDLLEDKLK